MRSIIQLYVLCNAIDQARRIWFFLMVINARPPHRSWTPLQWNERRIFNRANHNGRNSERIPTSRISALPRLCKLIIHSASSVQRETGKEELKHDPVTFAIRNFYESWIRIRRTCRRWFRVDSGERRKHSNVSVSS